MQKQNRHNADLRSYAGELHEKNKKRVKVSGLILIILPVILGLIRWMTDSDRILFLIIWVICMFALSAYLVSVEYLDHVLQRRLLEFTGEEEDDDHLVDGRDLIPPNMMSRITAGLDQAASNDPKEGGEK